MKFDELRLLVAIHNLRPTGDPVSDANRFARARQVRDEYTRMFGDVLFPWTTSEVIEMCVAWRKNKASRTKAEIAASHGYTCFWVNRGKGPCSDEVEGGHVIARAAGSGELSVQNGMIECRAHNNQRRERTIEEYLTCDDTTEPQEALKER